LEAEEEIDMSDMQWTLVDWLDRLPLRRFGPMGRAKLKLVNWLDNWFDDPLNPERASAQGAR
jgi:hypothetical protein